MLKFPTPTDSVIKLELVDHVSTTVNLDEHLLSQDEEVIVLLSLHLGVGESLHACDSSTYNERMNVRCSLIGGH